MGILRSSFLDFGFGSAWGLVYLETIAGTVIYLFIDQENVYCLKDKQKVFSWEPVMINMKKAHENQLISAVFDPNVGQLV